MADEFKFGINDAGNKFSGQPYVSPDTNDDGDTYEGVRGDDLSVSAAKNEGNLQYTKEKAEDDYLRLLMPKYTRRCEVEDLNRNFWVIGQALNSVGKNIKTIGDNITIINNIERTHFEITKERDRDHNDYSNYPHKIIFNEGINGMKTPFMVKDYCYRSIEFNDNGSVRSSFEYDSLWSRQIGGYNSADNAYKIGGYGTIPFLNFYKPRPDAIPIFTLVQTESSDTETHSASTPVINGGYDINIEGTNFKGRANFSLWHDLTSSNSASIGDVYVSNVYEICPIQAVSVQTITTSSGASTVTTIDPSGKVYTQQNSTTGYAIDYFPEGQEIIVPSGSVSGTYIKAPLSSAYQAHCGFTFPGDYTWQKKSSAKQLTLNYTDQKFIWNGNYWENLDLISNADGPTIPQYQIVENGSMFRVLGDTDEEHEIVDGSDTIPTINGKIFEGTIRNHDVVRNKTDGICFEWWDGAWRQIHNCDAAYVNIFIWFPQKTSTLRSVFYWTLKWLIPPGLGEY